jgi:MFS family permease
MFLLPSILTSNVNKRKTIDVFIDTFTLKQVRKKLRMKMSSFQANWQIYATGGFAAIGGFLFGYDLGVISGVITMSNFLVAFGDRASLARGSLTSAVSGSIVGVMSIGCFVGALLAGQASDRLSRKYSIVLFSVIFVISGALQAGSVNLFMLLVSRLIAGIKRMPF